MDQFLDDLFMPVLDADGNAAADDGLSDARSLAASMKGDANDGDAENASVKGDDAEFASGAEDSLEADLEIQSFSRESSFKRRSVLIQGLEHVTDGSLDFSSEDLATLIRGGKDSPDENK